MSKYEKILSTKDLITAILMLERKNAETSWEELNKYKDMKAFRRPFSKNPAYYEYLALGVMDLNPELMHKTNSDLEYRNSWDSYSKALRVVKPLAEESQDLVYWRICYPFPFSDRDYLYIRYSLELTAEKILELIESESEKEEYKSLLNGCLDKKYFTSACIPSEEHSESDDPGHKSGIIRVKEFHSICIVTSTNDGEKERSLLYTYLFDNPGGKIPSTLINWVAKTAMPKALDNTKKAGDKYKAWACKK